MAFPVVETTNQGHQNTSLETSHTVTLPATIAAGDLLIVLFAFKPGTANEATFPAGWTQFFDVESVSGSAVKMVGAWRDADGAEGASITVTTSESTRMAFASYRISGADDPATNPPEAATAILNNTINPDPPSLTPTGGSKEYLWLAAFTSSQGRITSTLPTNYTDNVGDGSDTGTSAHMGIGSGRRELHAASDDPGTFTTTGVGTEETVSAAIAIYPAPVSINFEKATVAQDDLGFYVDTKDVGWYATQIRGASIAGPVGILRWGLEQFGDVGILGYTPTDIPNVQKLNVRKA